MKRSRTCLLALSIAAVNGAQVRPFEAVPAHHEHGALRFRPSEQIDWSSLASDELRGLRIPSRDSSVVARFAPRIDMFGGVEVETAIPVPPDLAARVYYFVGADGISELTLDSTKVVTRLEFDSQGTTLRERRSWGDLYGSPSGLTVLAGGGFVLHSERPISPQASPSNLTADELLTGSQTVQQTPEGGYWGRGTAFWEIETQYRLTVESVDGEWVFVQWAPDREMMEAGCRFRYELFQIGPDGPAARIAWAAYGCDV
jgi:hypothetical protein